MDSMTHPTDTAKSEELKAIAHIMDRNVPNAHADGCPGCIDWARRMNEYAAKNPEEFKPIDLIARLNFLRSLPNSQRSNDAIDDAMEEAAEQLADLRARLASVANSVSSPPQNDAGVEGLREAKRKRRAALVERISTFADLLSSEPIEGEKGDIAYDLLRQAAAQIASDQRKAALPELQALGQEFEAGWRPYIGQEVRAASHIVEKWPDWQDTRLWVVGIAKDRIGNQYPVDGINVTVSDEWPVTSKTGGFTDGFYIGRQFEADDLIPSAPSGEGSDHG
ncbi:hypothetical protein [Sphingobium sp. YC-XJ3]|uniref:hypothetical protein n=1 Tax=Sphingobium sp. YC-XJ3 TaxID=3024245 RepID=UPI00235F427D|nr:hypothetical protein [Sphingobium sp. YC-XJ3]WDA37823.1 hypothetical protein PO876_06490 [Sphingobium sp. YC-XJ3]